MINATALLSAVGDGSAFAKGRDLAAWLGLTPRQHSTGGKTKMLGISKRGSRYLRKQLIHGARAAMPHLAAKPTRMGSMAAAVAGQIASECRGRGTSGQAGTHRMGGAAP